MKQTFLMQWTIRVVAVIAGLSGMAVGAGAQRGEPYRVLSLRDKSITHVDVETTGGNIEVVRDASTDPRVEVYVRVADQKKLTTDQLTAMLEKTYQLQLETEGNRLKAVATRINRSYKTGLSISFKVFVPAPGVNASLRTSGGDMHVENLHGEINGSTSSGSMTFSDIEGSLEAATSHGGIDARIAKITGPVKLKTSHGSISLAIPANTGADLELEGPRVTVPNLQDFSGAAGNTEIRGKLHGGGAVMQAKALHGRVKLIFQ